MAMNDDGEFELVLGNKQLFSVFFIVVVLLGVCFLMGYVVGKNSAPVLNAAIAPGKTETLVIPPATQPKDEPEESSTPAVTRTAPQAPSVAADVAPTPSQPATPPTVTPPKPTLPAFQSDQSAKAAPKQFPLGSQPLPGRVYLQLSAAERDSAEGMADLLRSKRFTAIAAQIPERPELYRVLVGPLNEADIAKTRADLKANSFPSDEAVRRVF